MPLRNVLGIFGDETIRLLREKWPNASMLAEELFAIFTGTDPINIPPGSTLQPGPNPAVPMLTVPNYTAGQTILNVPGQGALAASGGALTFTPTGGQPAAISGGGGGGGGTASPSTFPGIVVSGTGSSYVVAIYMTGLGGPTTNVNVTQLQIDPAATIPAGTWAMVTKGTDGSYSMQVSVWL